MRSLRVLGAFASVSSVLAFLVAPSSCANGDGSTISFGTDASKDVQKKDSFVAPPPKHDAGHDSGHDAGKPHDSTTDDSSDAGDGGDGDADTGPLPNPDGSYDAGILFYGNPGSPCSTLGMIQSQQCGVCGQQISTCIKRPDAGVPFDGGIDSGFDSGITPHDASATDAHADAHEDAVAPHDAGHDSGPPSSVWSEWGTCGGQIDGGCLPGTSMPSTCGTCGTLTLVCQNDCEYGATNCVGEVPDGCAPGSAIVTLGACADAGADALVVKEQQCSPTTCHLEDASACVSPPSTITISSSTGGETSTFVNMNLGQEDYLLNQTTDNMTGACPTTFVTPHVEYPAAFVTIDNSSSTMSATVSIWSFQPTGAAGLDIAVTAYGAIPTSNAEFENCTNVLQDNCGDTSDPTSCIGTYGGLMIGDINFATFSTNAVTIPAGKSIVFFLQDQFNDAMDTGVVGVTVRTESFQ